MVLTSDFFKVGPPDRSATPPQGKKSDHALAVTILSVRGACLLLPPLLSNKHASWLNSLAWVAEPKQTAWLNEPPA